jgi:Protein of unknown function (DUF2971)
MIQTLKTIFSRNSRSAFRNGYRYLYHWQPFNKKYEAYLSHTLTNHQIYCSNPANFNDPWDGKPFFNPNILERPWHLKKFINWSVEICKKQTLMSSSDIELMRKSFQKTPESAKPYIEKISIEIQQEISNKYRVYCLGPDPLNQLMWAHYADSHRGICIEFNLRNNLMCQAVACEYLDSYPSIPIYSINEKDNQRMILAKSKVWSYEKEYRIIAEEFDPTTTHHLPVTKNNFLDIPIGSITSIIVGCQADFNRVSALVKEINRNINVKQAVRIEGKYELLIVD